MTIPMWIIVALLMVGGIGMVLNQMVTIASNPQHISRAPIALGALAFFFGLWLWIS